MSDFLWVEASRDIEQERSQHKLALARVAAAEYWPMIAEASSELGVENKTALISEAVTALCEDIADSPAEVAVLAAKVLDGFRDDWRLVEAEKKKSSSTPGAPSQEVPAHELTR